MPVIGDIFSAKELGQTYQPLLLCEFTFVSGRVLRVSTHALSDLYWGTPASGSYEYGGFEWVPRVLNQDIGVTQAMSDLGLEVVPQVTIVLADPDKTIFNAWEIAEGFKGAKLRLYSVLWDAGDATTGSFSSNNPAPIKFIGTCGSSSFDDRTLTVTATSLLQMTQQQMPPLRIQPLCPWTFPTNFNDRSASVNDSSSVFYECGYSYGVAGGVGNAQTGTAAFTSCNYTFSNCIDRLGNSAGVVPIEKDKAGNFTGRFGGMDWIPEQSGLHRAYITGKWEEIVNASNESKYGDFVPMAYGTTWIEPMVMGTWGDGNYTSFEVLVCFGEINRIKKVVVNGVEVARRANDTDPGHRPTENSIPADSTTADSKNGDWSTINRGLRNGVPSPFAGWGRKGDPYGSLCAIRVTVLAQLAQADAVPSIQILLEGTQVRVYTDTSTFTKQFSENPAWILLDILTWANWKYDDVDLQSFIDAAAICDEQMFFVRQDGAFANVYLESGDPPYHRFTVGFALRQRSSIGEILRGLRNAMKALLYFDYISGKLKLKIKSTIASQQPNTIPGSNRNDAITSVTMQGVVANGYVAYGFDQTNIIKENNKTTLSVYQSTNQDAPNKSTVQFQNRENSYNIDSATIVDAEDISRLGQDVFGSMSLLGLHTFDHVRRIINTWFAENYRGNPRFDYRGSAIGDTGGTLMFQFTTTFKAIHLGVGDICLLTDAQLGFVDQPIRIVRIQPSTNFEEVKIVASFHNDNWYQDSFGQANQPIYAPAQGGVKRGPFSWRPGLEIPMTGDALYDVTDKNFQIGLRYDLAADGSYLANLLLTGKIPVNAFQPNLSKPKLEVLGSGLGSGSFPSGKSYWVAVSEKLPGTTATVLSAVSDSVMVPLSNSQSGLSFVVQSWPKTPSGYVAFAGLDPLAMSFQQEDTTNPQTIQMTGTYQQANWGPPDEAFANFRWRVTHLRHGGVWGDLIEYVDDAVTSSSIKISVFHNYGFATNEWAGREVSVYALAARTPGDVSTPIPIANFPVSGNDSDTLFLSAGNPLTCVNGGALQSGDVMVMRSKFTYGSDANGNYFEDSLWINELNPVSDKRIISDASNTTPITITLDLSDGSSFPFSDGDTVVVQYVQGNDAANGGWVISNCDPTNATFVLASNVHGGGGSSGNGQYTGDGEAYLQDRGLAPGAEIGMVAFIISGTGRGTWVKIKDNNQTRCYIDGDWPVVPDSTSRIIVIEPTPIVDLPSARVQNSTRELVSTLTVEVANYDRLSLLIQVLSESVRGLRSKSTLDPFREMYMIGSPGVQDIPGVTPFSVRAEGYAMITINNLGINSNAYAVSGMSFLIPSIDETDIGLWWVIPPIDGTSTVVTVTPTKPPNKSRFGTEFKDGDYILIRDEPWQYEICQMFLNVNGTITLHRHQPGSGAGKAWFGSMMRAHLQPSRIYRVIPKIFPNALTQNLLGTDQSSSKVPDKWQFPWANECVLAVVSQPSSNLGNGPTYTLSLVPDTGNKTPGFGSNNPNGSPPSPGLRTLNGAAYTSIGIPGTLTNGLTTTFRAKVQAWESIRCVYATVRTAPTVASVKVHVMYIGSEVDDPSVPASSVRVGLIDTVVIAPGNTASYPVDNQPRDRMMPYHSGGDWGIDNWPPSEFPVVVNGLDSTKELQLGYTMEDRSDSNGNVYYAPDGYIAAIIETTGADAADLTVVVQT